jgi:sulfide:quinone oxidoreductase
MTGTRRFRHVPMRVLVLGGGVAGLETCLALQALAGDRVDVTLIAPSHYLAHRPVDVRDPLDVRGRVRVPVARVAGAASVRHDRAVSIDTDARAVYTARGYRLPYDALVLAVGAIPEAVPPRAKALDEDHIADCRILMHQVREGRIGSLAFVEPPAPARSFDLYDLAIDTAVTLRRAGVDADLTLVTAQPGPLAILGLRTAGALRHTLKAHGLRVVESAYVRSIGYGEVELAPLSRRIAADRVIAAPRLAGPRLQNLPSDRDGFVPVDLHGRVRGLEAVFAAGDCTPFPVKHPSLAAQQADVVASTIAADAGLPVTAEPFTPVLRGVLPSRLRWYVEAPLTGGEGDATVVSPHPLWSPDLRFDARFLAPRLTQAVAAQDGATDNTASAPTEAMTTAIAVP